MKQSKRMTRLSILFAGMAVLLLTAARCGQSTPNSGAVQGSGLQGSGPSSAINTKAGAGSAWSNGSTPPNNLSQGLLDHINGYRLGKGLKTIAWHDGIGAVAQVHTADMVARSFFSIVNPDGVDPYQRMVSSTPRIDFDNAWAFVAQIAAGGPGDGTLWFEALLDNSVTRAIMENANVTHFGHRGANGGTIGTIIFAQNARP